MGNVSFKHQLGLVKYIQPSGSMIRLGPKSPHLSLFCVSATTASVLHPHPLSLHTVHNGHARTTGRCILLHLVCPLRSLTGEDHGKVAHAMSAVHGVKKVADLGLWGAFKPLLKSVEISRVGMSRGGLVSADAGDICGCHLFL